jgi:hypothetical protein
MRRTVALMIAVSFTTASVVAVDGRKAQYVGGTVTGLQEKAEAPFLTNDEAAIRFDAKNKGTVEIPYASITGLEYGQKAGRRVAVAVLVSPLALFSKKRNHYLTITFNDSNGKEQAAVFELGKDIVRTTLTVLQIRSGKEIEYQDEEARKSGVGGTANSAPKPSPIAPASASAPAGPSQSEAASSQKSPAPTVQSPSVKQQGASVQSEPAKQESSGPSASVRTAPAVEGRSPQQVIDLLGQPQYVLEGRDGVATWFYELDGKAVRVFIFESKASLTRQK